MTRPESMAPLGPLQADVMEVLWRDDEATVRRVLEALNVVAERPLAYTTVMTALYRLDQKGLVSRRRDGNADVYRARLSRAAHTQAQAKARTDALVDQFGDVAYIAMARRIAHEHRDALRA